jgi:foldase protein PrsA
LNKQFIYATLFFAFVAAAGCSKAPSSTPDTMATVDGVQITGDDFNKYIQRMPEVKINQNGRPVPARPFQELGYQALQSLIEQKLLLEIAKDEGVSPTDKQVEDEIDFRRGLDPNFVANLQHDGLTMQDIRDSVRLDLARFNALTRGITVSDAETQQFIKDHPKNFQSPATADVLWVVVTDDKTKGQVDQDLASGSPFTSVAMRYSKDPKVRQFEGKYNNGQAAVTVISQMPQALQDIVNSTPELKSSAWTQDRGIWIKFYIQSKTPAKMVDMNQYRIKAVQKALMEAKGTRHSDINKQLMAKLRSAKVQITVQHYADMWKQSQDELAQTMDQAAASGASAPAGKR